jgi:tRNA dimethylallyltransferase
MRHGGQNPDERLKDVANGPKAILIAGPTASGKSALAVELARRHGGVVINADSMQVYRELRIITARPDAAEEALAPHRLFGMVSAATRFSAGRWLEAAAGELAAARVQGCIPIFAGGTGLYFKVLTEGIAEVPEVPDELVANWRGEAERVGAEMLHEILTRRDPEMAAMLAPGDGQRIIRALSVLDATGRSLLDFQRAQASPPLLKLEDCRALFLDPERDWLYRRINTRFDAMIEGGALEEVAALKAMNLDPALPAMRAHGVPSLLAHLEGEMGLDAAVTRAKTDTRRYAKRQKTWFRHQMADWEAVAIDGGTALEDLVDLAGQPLSA